MTATRIARPTTLATALLLACITPAAFAQDAPCLNPDGTPVVPAPGTDQGNEHGTNNTTCAPTASAYGYRNNASGNNAIAIGIVNQALFEDATAIGNWNTATGDASTAIGYYNIASGPYSAAMGMRTVATGLRSAALGRMSWASGESSVAMGGWYDRDGNGFVDYDTHVGPGSGANVSSTEYTIASGKYATAVGPGAVAATEGSVALGADAAATHENSVAIGYHSATDRANSVSVGNAGLQRQITHVAAGTQATDAVNLQQMQAGDAATLGSARTYADTRATAAVNTANAYTDGKFAAWNDNFLAYQRDVDGRLAHMDGRIDRNGAMGTALATMAASTAGIRTANRVGVGVGSQGGKSALAIGYQRALSDRATLTFGGSFSGGSSSAGVGLGLGW